MRVIRPQKIKKIIIFGCSHSRSFKEVSLPDYKVEVNTISGASVKGLRKMKSHLQVSDSIRKSLKENSGYDIRLVLKLGQVDIENGFLYKKYCTKNFDTFDKHLDDVFESYKIFIKSITSEINPKRIILWGVNPPSPVDKNPVIPHYLSSMGIKENNPAYKVVGQDKLFLEDLEYKNRLTRARLFNKRLKNFARMIGATYAEVFNEMLDSSELLIKHFEGRNFHIKGVDAKERFLQPDALVKKLFTNALRKHVP